jgi:hypothetical protein
VGAAVGLPGAPAMTTAMVAGAAAAVAQAAVLALATSPLATTRAEARGESSHACLTITACLKLNVYPPLAFCRKRDEGMHSSCSLHGAAFLHTRYCLLLPECKLHCTRGWHASTDCRWRAMCEACNGMPPDVGSSCAYDPSGFGTMCALLVWHFHGTFPRAFALR